MSVSSRESTHDVGLKTPEMEELTMHTMHSMIVPVYQSEISPADHRGKLACMEFTGRILTESIEERTSIDTFIILQAIL